MTITARLSALIKQTIRQEEDIREDLEAAIKAFRRARARDLGAVVRSAWDTAKQQREFVHAESPVPQLELKPAVEAYDMHGFPAVLVAVLQEWLYNAMKWCPGPTDRIVVDVRGQGRWSELTVAFSAPLPKDWVLPFLPGWESEQAANLSMAAGMAQTFVNIGELCEHAFGNRPRFWWQNRSTQELVDPDTLPREEARSFWVLRIPLRRRHEGAGGVGSG